MSRKGRRGSPLFEEEAEMRLRLERGMEEREGCLARQVASQRVEGLEVVDGHRSKKVSDRHEPDERAPFCHSEMERAVLIHQVSCFR